MKTIAYHVYVANVIRKAYRDDDFRFPVMAKNTKIYKMSGETGNDDSLSHDLSVFTGVWSVVTSALCLLAVLI